MSMIKPTGKRQLLAAASVFLSIVFMSGYAMAQQRIGRITSVEGPVKIKSESGQDRPAPRVGAYIHTGDELITGNRGLIRVLLNDDSVVTLGSQSRLLMDKFMLGERPKKRTGIMRLLLGRLKTVVSRWASKRDTDIEVRTPSAVAGVRGTSFVVWVDIDGFTEVLTLTGQVEVLALNENLEAVQSVVLNPAMKSRVGGGNISPPTNVGPDELGNVDDQFNGGGGSGGSGGSGLLNPIGGDDDDDDGSGSGVGDDDDDDDGSGSGVGDDDDDDDDSGVPGFGDDDDDDTPPPPPPSDPTGGGSMQPNIDQQPVGSGDNTTRLRMNFEIAR